MKSSSSPMILSERILGGLFLVLYFLVLPFTIDTLFGQLSELLHHSLSDPLRNLILYYGLFALTLLLFWHYISDTTRFFFSCWGKVIQSILLGFIGFCGLTVISSPFLEQMLAGLTNMNDASVFAHWEDAPHSTALVVLFLAPFVEETLFRGYVFGNLRTINRTAAYLVSCLLFGLLHVWQFALLHQSPHYLLLMLQYLVPGLTLAWVYEHSETLWGSFLLHAAINTIALRSFL